MKTKFSYNENSDKVVWIDLDNSPHIPFFAPIIERLNELGYSTSISARNYAQTVALAELYNLDFTPIGKHHGKNKLRKIVGLLYRSLQLIPYAIKNKPTIAISHGSRAQMVVAQLLGIPVVMFLDYEFVQTIPFVKLRLLFIPKVISTKKLSKFADILKTYPGIKEDIYVPTFKPDESIKTEMNIKDKNINVVLRPPADQAHYHNPESEILFYNVIEHLTATNNIRTIILPRDKRQKESIETQFRYHFDSGKLAIPKNVVDALNLMWYSDLVISGGGTMNREAAALGIPVYSIFRGKTGDVDKYLTETGRLTMLESPDDVKEKVKLEKWIRPNKLENVNSLGLQSIVNDLEKLIAEVTKHKKTYKHEINNEATTKQRIHKKIH
jgi:predicted glycosyltransferase